MRGNTRKCAAELPPAARGGLPPVDFWAFLSRGDGASSSTDIAIWDRRLAGAGVKGKRAAGGYAVGLAVGNQWRSIIASYIACITDKKIKLHIYGDT
jgi:hypothetical protein